LKVWRQGQVEPSVWAYKATDDTPALQADGSVGLHSFLSRDSTNAPVRYTFDDLAVLELLEKASSSAPAAPTTIASDSFGRSLADAWGGADSGGSWTLQGPSAEFDVDGAAGTMLMAAPGRSRTAALMQTSARDVDLSVRLRTDKDGSGEHAYLLARREGTGTTLSEYRARLRIGGDGAVFLRASRVSGGSETGLGSEVRVSGLSHAPGSWLRLRAEFSGASPTTIRLRAWADGSPEPTAWALSLTDSTASLQGTGAVGLQSYLSSIATNAPLLVSFDDLSVVEVK
jgi:hypothetical protein